MEINGTVYDSSGTTPLPNAIAMAVRLKDSLLLGFSHSNKNGDFTITNCPIDTFTLTIMYPKCDDRTYFIYGSSTNTQINLKNIKMQAESTQIGEVIIYANKNPIYYRGDTLVYVADSFKVAENAVVEDLLKRLPGIKVEKDGKIKSQGKEISQVLVDGDEFFGNDATIATKNLGADGVKSVEVYEKKNENSTGTDDETIQVMNLKLKEEAKKGYFGRTSLASDFQQFYQGEFLMNKYNGSQKISIFVLGSNTPYAQLGWGDENKFGLDNERDISYDDDGNAWWTSTQITGVPQTLKAGVYYSDKIGEKKKTKIATNYSFYDSRINSNTKDRSQYFLGDTTYFSDDSTHSYQFEESHKVNFSLETDLDSLTKISVKPKLNYKIGTTENIDITNFLAEDLIKTRATTIHSNSDSKGLTFDNEANLIRKFKKPKRELFFSYTLSTKSNAKNGNLLSINNYFDGISVNDTIDQLKTTDNSSITHIEKLIFTEPLTKKYSLEIDYMNEYAVSNQNKETRGNIEGGYALLDSAFSNNFENIRQINRLGAMLIYKTKKYSLYGGARVRNVDVTNKNLYTTSTIHQNVNSILPRFTFVYNPTMSKRISINYSTAANQPSITSMQPVPDNTNPNRIVKGNSNLKPSYTQKIDLNMNAWQALTGRYFYMGMNVSFINNAFVDSTVYDAVNIGKMSSQTVNADGNIQSFLYGGCGIPVYKKIITLNSNFNGNYYKNINFIDGQKNITQTRTIGGSLGAEFIKDSIEISIDGELQYNSPVSSISTISNTPYNTKTLSADIVLKLPGHFKIATSATYTMNSKRADGYNINYLIWNAEINRSFLKTENLVLSIMGNDILNQNISASRYVSSNVITDNKTKIISRYFLVKLTLKFNNNKTKENDENEGW